MRPKKHSLGANPRGAPLHDLVGATSGNRTRTTIARLVTRGRPPGDLRAAEAMLFHALASVPADTHAKFLLTPGGYVLAPWPSQWSPTSFGWTSTPSDFRFLARHVTMLLPRVLTQRVLREAQRSVDVIALGVDVERDEDSGAHAEMIVVVDVVAGTTRISGKSYPRESGSRVMLAGLATHLVRIARERVLVLGCHDLNLFSPRGGATLAVGGERERIRAEATELVQAFQPTVALQLPHGTDTAQTWTSSWNALHDVAPSIRAWASGVAHYNVDDRPQGPRKPIEHVRQHTCGGDACFDITI